MHHDFMDKLSFEFELFRCNMLSQSRENIFSRSSEVFFKTRIFHLLNEMNEKGDITFELKQKMMLKADIIDSIYMYLLDVNYMEADIKQFIIQYINKHIEPIEF